MPRHRKGEPTATNLYALRRHFDGRTRAPNQIEPPSVPHLRRCLRAGLVEVDGSTPRLGRLRRARRDDMTSQNAKQLAAQCRARPPTVKQLVSWIGYDDRVAAEEDRVSMRELMALIYGMRDWIGSDRTYADEHLVAAGLLAAPADRTEDYCSWKTPLGRRVGEHMFYSGPATEAQ